jgi:uncharacterized damage-inducible protein DinB
MQQQGEYWQRGPIEGIAPLLQPVVHALLQAREEVTVLMRGFNQAYLWDRPAGVASVGFHLQHLTGVLDRLFTYARNEHLTSEQRHWLEAEGRPLESNDPVSVLLHHFDKQVDKALIQLRSTPESTLTEARGIGRAQIPTTVLGLLFHAAEHTLRHVGQLHVTVRVLMARS